MGVGGWDGCGRWSGMEWGGRVWEMEWEMEWE